VVGVSGNLASLPVPSSASAGGGVKKAGLRAKVFGIMVAALLERRLLPPVRVLGADVRRIGNSIPESEPSSLDCVDGKDEGDDGLSGL
jgi:hypothetical protein